MITTNSLKKTNSMGNNSAIQWTDATWNIARGCTKVDEDCKFCYMYRDSFDGTRYNPLKIVRTKTVFNLPLKLQDPSLIFTSSLTDFFHPDIDSYRNEAWDIIRKCPQHTFQILTKRPERIIGNLPEFWEEINSRCWIGTSIGHNDSTRVRELIKASILEGIRTIFLSIEPLYEPICFLRDYYFDAKAFNTLKRSERTMLISFFDWIIIGGESGNNTGKYKFRECKLGWIESIVNECTQFDVPVFVKQLGTHLAKEMKLKDRHGGNMEEWPQHLQIRQMPVEYSLKNL
jgi:protein gp37